MNFISVFSLILSFQAPPDLIVDGSEHSIYHRIVSLSPSITETLFLLRLGSSVAGVTKYCDYPEEAKNRKVVGGYLDPNYEAILELQPDLIILLEGQGQTNEKLISLGFKTLEVNHRNIESIHESIKLIGDECGTPHAAMKILEDIQHRIKWITDKKEKLKKPRVLVSIGRSWGEQTIRQLQVVGEDGFFSEIIAMAGGQNVYVDRVPFPQISNEGLYQLDPDMIIDLVPDLEARGFDPTSLLKDWDVFSDLRAVREKQVHVVGEGFMVIPGPRYVAIVETFFHVFHPEEGEK